jgi:NDP-sugar pyrophosphorylase family protein
MIEAIPLLDEYDRVTSIAYYGFDSEECNPIVECPVVIMAGGKGKRLFPYTKILPKPLIPIDDTPISQRIIEAFIKLGCKDFHIIVNYKKNMIKAYYADAGIDAKISFVDEDTPLGTGGGLKLLEGKLDETFVLTNCDILIMANLSDIIEHHRNQHNSVTMVCSLKDFEIPYGVVNFEEGGEIKSFEEKPKMSFFTNTGYYILEPEIMNYINDNEVIGMPDIIERMRTDGKKVGIYPISESSWLDMGQFDSMEGMERRLKELRMD